MSFLTPLFFLGLAALSLPILFHLIRRTPRGRQPFSSLMFLTASPPRLTRRSRLDNLLLLMLRALAICLLIVAFARPFLREAVDLSLIDARGRRIAIVLDTSASMRRGNVWQQAQREVQKTLDALEAGDDVCLITFDDAVQTVVEFEREGPPPTQKNEVVQREVAKLAPSWGSTDVGRALRVAAEALQVSNDLQQSDAALQINLITDLQQGARIESLQAYEWPVEVALSINRLTADKPSNATVRVLHDEEADSDELRVRISNSAESAVDQFYLGWNHELGEAAQDPHENLAIYVPPGQSRIVRMERSETNRNADHLVLSGDDFDFDNRFYTAPLVQQELTICYLGTDAPDDPDGVRYYLELALADTFRRRIKFSSPAVGEPSALTGDSPPDFAVAAGVLDADEIAQLKSFVERGGCALVVANSPPAAVQLARFDEGLQVFDGQKKRNLEYAMLGEVDFSHPVFATFASQQYNDFTKIHFWNHAHIEIAEGTPARVIAEFDDESPALWEHPLGQGKLYVLASGWDPENSTLARSSKFVPLLVGILDQAAGAALPLPSFTVHETIPFERAGDRAIVRTPSGELIRLDDKQPTFAGGAEPGIYELQQAAGSRTFAVNLAARESETNALDLEQFEQLGIHLGVHETRSEEIERQRQLRDIELEGRQQIWRWLIVAGLAVLGLETVVAGRQARKTGV